ncbi:MAG: hypothetical protein QM811_26510 [Pirellulales bacterium]
MAIPKNILRGLALVACLVSTWLFFGPLAAFHHQYLFGILGYMLWNGEDPDPAALQFVSGYEVVFSPARFAATVCLWLLAQLGVLRLWRSASSD